MDSSVATVSAEKVADGRERILNELRKVIVGQDEVVEQVLIALFTGGHCLITGVPGLAKTLMIKTLADILDLDFKRIQFTPDLMPSDITGTEILDEEQGTRRLRFVNGPVFAQIILADEINRTPPNTQAALREARQEHHVTSAGAPDFINKWVKWGSGLRGSQALVRGGKARALMHGRYHVSIKDIQALAKPILRHRIMTNFYAESERVTSDIVVDRLLDTVPVPKSGM